MTEIAPSTEQAAFAWTFGQAVFDEGRWELLVTGQAQALERKPLEVLAYLLRHAGEVVTKDELLDAVWTGRVVVEGALTNAIGKLRKSLGDEEQSLIVTRAAGRLSLDGKGRAARHQAGVAAEPVERRRCRAAAAELETRNAPGCRHRNRGLARTPRQDR
ncbi:MAG: winged helix-turn-helix domain-containing protein [Chiayiivirga sp.]|jgi:hypothetical protein|nr:winged helix-turn-helix domain-containing protein [Chiayiivirga sp.]